MSFISDLFGGEDALKPVQDFRPSGFSGGGLTGTFSNNMFNVSPTAERTAALGGIQTTFGDQAKLIADLRAKVTPGFSDFRAARLAEIDNAKSAAVGNLRDNLARRRVLGSSFAQDAVTRAESEFAQQRERVAAESFMQELETTNNLIQQEFELKRGAFQAGLDEMNLEANIAANLSGRATDVMSRMAALEAQLTAQSQAGAGKFFGQLVGTAGTIAAKAAGAKF